jgi:hypothetical protein
VVVPERDPVTRQVSFAARRAMRNFGESVAIDAAFSESGLFELRQDDPMLLPFEGLGVEAQWTLELPKAFNRFNFDTIADVLVQIDYTALLDRQYRAQVLAALPAREIADSAFDLAFAFPDEWYQLKNPRPADPPADRAMTFALSRPFFPPQFETAPAPGGGPALAVKHVALVVVGDFAVLARDPTEHQRLRAVIRDGFQLEKDGVPVTATSVSAAGAPAFRFREVSDRMAFFTTREAAAALSPSHFDAVEAPGTWTLTLGQPLFAEVDDDGRPLVRRIINALLVVTVEGRVAWS